MANSATAGTGLSSTSMLGNTPAPQGQSAYKIDAGYGTAIYNGAPVVSAAGYMTEGTVVTTGTTILRRAKWCILQCGYNFEANLG